ncbi:MAG: ACP S-malonyltransferase [Candidatus Nanopelagicales bacterium]
MLCVVAPGQGAQTPEMLSPWLELPGVAELLADWSAASKVDLLLHGTKSDAETIRDTAIAQALLVANSLLSIKAIFPERLDLLRQVHLVAGHSVGELAAAAISGVINDEAAMSLVGVRGRAMALSAAVTPTSMTAVLGGDPAEVIEHLANLDLVAANVNGAGQIIAAGSLEALAKLAENPPERTRLRPLSVAGAFHTQYMASAVEALRGAAIEVAITDPEITLLSNSDGAIVDTGTDAIARIVNQVSNPVRWDLCQKSMQRLGVTGIVELAPGGTLTNIAKREFDDVQTFAIKSPADLAEAKEFILTHQRRAA